MGFHLATKERHERIRNFRKDKNTRGQCRNCDEDAAKVNEVDGANVRHPWLARVQRRVRSRSHDSSTVRTRKDRQRHSELDQTEVQEEQTERRQLEQVNHEQYQQNCANKKRRDNLGKTKQIYHEKNVSGWPPKLTGWKLEWEEAAGP